MKQWITTISIIISIMILTIHHGRIVMPFQYQHHVLRAKDVNLSFYLVPLQLLHLIL
uniref:Uncharacterized protein n=1 Tax=Rhizophora mucronata TaxID=61149 RepID=A0A2P2NYM8_RHIMU